jgi:hypothetical protein
MHVSRCLRHHERESGALEILSLFSCTLNLQATATCGKTVRYLRKVKLFSVPLMQRDVYGVGFANYLRSAPIA